MNKIFIGFLLVVIAFYVGSHMGEHLPSCAANMYEDEVVYRADFPDGAWTCVHIDDF